MGIDYYSYVIAGVDACNYISPLEYEEKTPSYVEIKGKRKRIYRDDGKPIFNICYKVGWIFNSQIYKSWDELEKALASLGLSLTTQGCEHEIWKGDALGLFISSCEHSVNLDLDIIQSKLNEVEIILKSIGIVEKSQVINILHVDY